MYCTIDTWPEINADKLVADIHDERTTVEVADLEHEEHYVGGERLTDDRADELAGQMLKRVRAKNLVSGGKSLSGGREHSPVVQTRVSVTTRDKLLRSRSSAE